MQSYKENKILKHAAPLSLMLLAMTVWECGWEWTLVDGCGAADRALYPLCHVNVWHMLANLYAMWMIIKSNFRDKAWMWVAAYMIAVSVPPCAVATMGLSGVVYAVMGMISHQAVERKKFHAWTLGFMALGLLFPDKVNNMLHLWCYLLGILVGYGDMCRGCVEGKHAKA